MVRFSCAAKEIDGYDVIVCGAGPAGIGASIAASRNGARTLLVERFCSSAGVAANTLIGIWLGSYSRDGKHPVIAGIFREIVDELVAEGAAIPAERDPGGSRHLGYASWHNRTVPFEIEPCKRVCEQAVLKSGVEIRYLTNVIGTHRSGGIVEGVFIHGKEGISFVRGRCFVDATGDGDVAYLAGFPTVTGEKGSGLTSPGSLIPVVTDVDFAAFERYCRDTGDIRLRNVIAGLDREGKWPFSMKALVMCETTIRGTYFINGLSQPGVDGTDSASMTKAAVNGRSQARLLVELLQSHLPGFSRARLVQTSPVIGIRETRRITGVYTVTERDLIDGTCFPDAVALSGYRWDMESPSPQAVKSLSEVPRDRPPSDEQPMEGVEMAKQFAEIPYRSLLPKGSRNLIVAGRCISVTRNVLGPLRVMPVCFATGQAAGTAAALSARGGAPIGEIDRGELRRLLADQGAILSGEGGA